MIVVVPLQISKDGAFIAPSFQVNVLSKTFFIALDPFDDPFPDDHGEIWARNYVTLRTQEKILDSIKMAYPSVSHVDHVVVATWYDISHREHGWVCSYCIVII